MFLPIFSAQNLDKFNLNKSALKSTLALTASSCDIESSSAFVIFFFSRVQRFPRNVVPQI